MNATADAHRAFRPYSHVELDREIQRLTDLVSKGTAKPEDVKQLADLMVSSAVFPSPFLP